MMQWRPLHYRGSKNVRQAAARPGAETAKRQSRVDRRWLRKECQEDYIHVLSVAGR